MNSTFGALQVQLSNKFGNQSTVYFTQADRANALNWARNVLGYFDFPDLLVVSTLTFSPYTRNGNLCAQAATPTDLQREVQLWDGTNNLIFSYDTPNQFDFDTNEQVFTREYTNGTNYFYVNPSTQTSLYLRYIKAITQFGTDGTAVNEFAPQYDDIIINGAVMWLENKDRDHNDESNFEENFERDVRRMYQNLANPGGWQQYSRLTSLWDADYDLLDRGLNSSNLVNTTPPN